MKRCEPDTFKTVRYLIVGAEKLPEDLSAAFREKIRHHSMRRLRPDGSLSRLFRQLH